MNIGDTARRRNTSVANPMTLNSLAKAAGPGTGRA
jgi:hypothetical protein